MLIRVFVLGDTSYSVHSLNNSHIVPQTVQPPLSPTVAVDIAINKGKALVTLLPANDQNNKEAPAVVTVFVKKIWNNEGKHYFDYQAPSYQIIHLQAETNHQC